MLPRFVKIMIIASCPFAVTSCNTTVPTITSTISAIKPAIFEDLRISTSVKDFKAAGFHYGDMIQYTYEGVDGQSHTHIVPFVSNYLTAGLFSGSICDYEKAGKAINICLGFSDDYDSIKIGDINLIGNEIKFVLYQKNGWNKYYERINLGTKNTYNTIGRNNYIFTNSRDIKVVNGNIDNDAIKSQTIYRMSNPFDDKYNAKRFAKADNVLGEIIDDEERLKNTILVTMNYEDFVNSSNYDFVDARVKDGLAPNFIKLVQYGSELRELVIGINTGDNFYSRVNQERNLRFYTTLLNKVKSRTGEYAIVFCDSEGIVRAGFITMILEALAGASYKTIVDDYMLSFVNYYDIIKSGSFLEEFNILKDFTIDRIIYPLYLAEPNEGDPTHINYEKLKTIDWTNFSATKALENCDLSLLKDKVTDYLTKFIGLSDTQVNNLKKMVHGEQLD